MTALILPNRRISQPQGLSNVNWDAIPGLSRVYNPGLSPFSYEYPGGLVNSVLNGSPIAAVGENGRTIAWDGINDCLYENSSPLSYTFKGTMFALVKPTSGFDTVQQTLVSAASVGYTVPIFRLATTGSAAPVGRFMFQLRNIAGSFANINSSDAIVANKIYFVIGTCFGDYRTANLYVNGALQGTGSAPDGSATQLGRFGFGSFVRNIPELTFNGHIYLAGFASEPLSDAQAKSFSDNPWQIFTPQKRVIYFDVGAGAGSASGTLAATENGADTFAASGNVIVSGALTVSETGSDTFQGSGAAVVSGTLAATETGTDTFQGFVAAVASGTLAATETGSDTLSASGNVIVSGALTATEAGDDTFLASGNVIVSGALTVTETGSDTVSASGNVIVSGALTVTETGSDVFQGSGADVSFGSLSVTETGDDTFSATGSVVVSGTWAATEQIDTFSASGNVIVAGTLAVAETGQDTFSSAGGAVVAGTLSATESGSDTFAAAGTFVATGDLIATEQNDTFFASGNVIVDGVLSVTEQADTFSASGDVINQGLLDATETGSDIFLAYDSGSAPTSTDAETKWSLLVKEASREALIKRKDFRVIVK